MELLLELDQIRIVMAISMLGIATISDIKKREVSNIVWLVFGVIGITAIVFAADPSAELINIGISLLVAPVALMIWRFGMFGGADAFAVIIISLLAPGLTITGGSITPFTVLMNALLLSLVPMFINAMWNVILIARGVDIFEGFAESRGRKIFAMLIGRRTANPRFGFSMELQESNGKKLNLKMQHAEHAAFCKRKDTWVTLGTPYMIFILAGFVVQLVYGDFVFGLFNSLS